MGEILRIASLETGAAIEAAQHIGAETFQAARNLLGQKYGAQASEKALTVLSGLHIPETRIEPIPGLILPFESTIKGVTVRNSKPGHFANLKDFSENCLDRVPTQVRVYKVPGTTMTITVPETFMANMESGRPMFEGKHIPGLVGPHEMIPLLNEMPNKTLFRNIFISDKTDPYQDWNSHITGSKPFLSEMSMDNGEFRTFGTSLNPYLRRDTQHEWSHQMRFRFWDDPMLYRFFEANFFEQPEWVPSAYSKRTTDEMWAVLGERYTGTSTGDFLEATDKAPIRSVIWGDAFSKTLQEVPESARSIHHQAYVDRANYIKEFASGPALNKVHGYLNQPHFDRQKSMNLMNYLEGKPVLDPPGGAANLEFMTMPFIQDLVI